MILITGCAGFIGFHLAYKLSKRRKVIGIDSLDKYYSVKLKKQRLNLLKKNKKFKFLKIDLNNFKKLKKELKNQKIEYIVHLAAQPGVRISTKNPHNTLIQNLLAFSNIIEVARLKKIKKFVYASSSSIYGDTKTYPFVENDYKNIPKSVYGATKLSNEIIANSYSRNFKIQAVGLRFFTVYGPYGRPDMAYYSFLNKLNMKKKIQVFNNGKMMRDFTYIDDVINGIIKVIKTNFKNKHEILNIGKGKPDDLMDLINNLEKYYNENFSIEYLNIIPKGDIQKTFSDTKKAKKLIKLKPKVDLKEGVKKFVSWYKKNHKIK